MPVRILPIILLVVPVLEIAVFILVGGQIGLGWTLLLILATAVLGTMLLRRQGFAVLERMREDVNLGRVPAAAMAHGVLIIVAGVLLLTPGFVTDALGFMLFVPQLRVWVWQILAPIFFARLSGRWSRWPGANGQRPDTSHTTAEIGSNDATDGDDPGQRR
ncbi:MAG: FxsA family protein [Alphaproteobacteria bacterium]